MEGTPQDALEPQAESTGTSQEAVLTPEQDFQLQLMTAEKQFRGGASWFYWIAGLSLVNSICFLTGAEWSFLAGLGLTQLVDGIVYGLTEETQISESIKYIGFAINILIAGVYVLIGFLSLKRFKAAMIVGMVFYALDGLVFLLVMDLLSIGFHAFALFCIFGGLKGLNRLQELEAALTAAEAEAA